MARFLMGAAVAAVLVLFSALAAPPSASAQDDVDLTGAAVFLTNSFIADGSDEQVFEGPDRAVVAPGDEFTGFGGFDVDVSGGSIVMAWSADPDFDDFEGEFDDTFTDIFTFEFDGADLLAANVEPGNLVPDIEVTSDGRLRVVFSEGMVYGDGRQVVIRTQFDVSTSTAEPAESSAASSTAASSSTTTTGGASASTERSEAMTTMMGEPFRPLNMWDRPNPIPSVPLETLAEAGTGGAAPQGLAATGAETTGATIGVVLLAAGGLAHVAGRRLAG